MNEAPSNEPVLEVLDPGLGLAFQDLGRPGWRRFGVPPGGAMDRKAAIWANHLLENPLEAPVLEMLLQGARFHVLRGAWIAVTGAESSTSLPLWKTVRIQKGDMLSFPENRSGVWTYLAVAGGWSAPVFLQSASVYARGGFGKPLARGDLLSAAPGPHFDPPSWLASRMVPFKERPGYSHPPAIPVHPGPQWDFFSKKDRALFFKTGWVISSRSDRTGYRLEGPSFQADSASLESEPVLAGSIQIPQGGFPIVTMPDGPTVGGYPKLGLADPNFLHLLAQCRPGARIRFQPAE